MPSGDDRARWAARGRPPDRGAPDADPNATTAPRQRPRRPPPPGSQPPPPGNQPPPPGNQPPAQGHRPPAQGHRPPPPGYQPPPGPGEHATTQLPRGTGGQRPVSRGLRPPAAAPAPRPTEQFPRRRRFPDAPDDQRRPGDPYEQRRPDVAYDDRYPDDPYDDRYPAEPYEPPRPDGGYGRRPVDPRQRSGSDRAPQVRRPAGYPVEGKPPGARQHHLPPYTEPDLDPTPAARGPRKLTVTRVAALRSKELTNKGVQLFRKAASADGADRSGLTHLTYAVMANYAVDAALAVALANTLFFAAASAESTGKVLLYLLITVAPFAVIAPFIGPLLDKVQTGRRVALGITSFGRTLLAVVMAFNFDSWILYPCALGMMVLSKSFGVLKAALTPRVLPEQITLVKTNSRLTVFGLVAGGVSGAIAAGFAALSNSSGALIWTALCGAAGGWLCLRIPAWVESTAGEVPIQHSEVLHRGKRRSFPPLASATLWANVANRVETGFLALFIAFVVKTEYSQETGFRQLLLLGLVGAAAGAGGFIGNGLGSQLPLRQPHVVATISVGCVALTTLVATMLPGLAMGVVVGLVGSTSSSLAKVCLDSVLQHELPEASRASAFGLSESALQLAWVSGGVVGLLLGGVLHLKGDPVFTLGFGVITVLVALGITQSWLARTGRTLLPGLSGLLRRTRRPAAGSAPGSPGTRPYPPGGHQGGPHQAGPVPQRPAPPPAGGGRGGRRARPRKASDPR